MSTATQYNSKFFQDNTDKKLRVTFDGPVKLRGMARPSTAATVKIFYNNGTYGYLAGAAKRKGGYLWDFPTHKVTGVEEVKPKDKLSNTEFARKVHARMLKALHPNAWNSLKSEAEKQKIEKYANGEEGSYLDDMYLIGRFKSTRAIFEPYEYEREMQALRAAFENGTDYEWYRESKSQVLYKGRDRRISVKRQPDGTVCAWFSSEYHGCGNGDYWLLLSPETAIFGEKD